MYVFVSANRAPNAVEATPAYNIVLSLYFDEKDNVEIKFIPIPKNATASRTMLDLITGEPYLVIDKEKLHKNRICCIDKMQEINLGTTIR